MSSEVSVNHAKIDPCPGHSAQRSELGTRAANYYATSIVCVACQLHRSRQ